MIDFLLSVLTCALAFAAGAAFGKSKERDRLSPFVWYAVKKLEEAKKKAEDIA